MDSREGDDPKKRGAASPSAGEPPGAAGDAGATHPEPPTRADVRSRRARRIAILAAAVAILFPTLVLFAAWVAVNAGALNGILERRLSDGLGGKWRVGGMRTFGISGLNVLNVVWESPDGRDPAAKFPVARIRWSAAGLLRGEIDGIYCERPEISIRKLADGGYNIRIPKSKGRMQMAIREAEASNGRMYFYDGVWRRRWVNIRMSMRNLTPGSLCSYRIEADTVFEAGGKEEIRGRFSLRGSVDVDSLDFEPEYLLAIPEDLDLDLAEDVSPKLQGTLARIRTMSGRASIRGKMQNTGGGVRPEFLIRLKDPRIEFDGWGLAPGDIAARVSGTWRERGGAAEVEDAEIDAEGIGRIRGSLTLDGRTWAPTGFRISEARLDPAAILAGLKIPHMEAIRIEGNFGLRDVEGTVSIGPAEASVRAAGTAVWGPLLFEAPARGISLWFREGRADVEMDGPKLFVRGLSASGLRGSQVLSVGRMSCLLDLRFPWAFEVQEANADLDLSSILSHPFMLQFDIFRRSPLDGRGVIRLRSFSFRPASRSKAVEGRVELEGTMALGRSPAALQTPPLIASAAISADGNFSELSLNGISLDAASAARVGGGRLDIRRGDDGEPKLSLSAAAITLDLESLCQSLRMAEAGISASGRVAIEKLEAADILGGEPSLSAKLGFEGVSVCDPAGLLRLDGVNGSADVSLAGGLASLSGLLALEAFSVAGKRFPLGPRPARIEVSAARRGIAWHLDRCKLEAQLPGLEDIAVDVRTAPAEGGAISFAAAIACPKLGIAGLRVEGKANPAAKEVGPICVKFPETAVADVLAFLRSRGFDPTPGWKLDGRLKGEGELAPFAFERSDGVRPRAVKGRIRLEVSGGKFESPDGNTMGDRLGVKLDAEVEAGPGGIGEITCGAEVTDVEALVGGKFYLDRPPAGLLKIGLRARPVRRGPSAGGIREIRLNVSAGRMGTFYADGDLASDPVTGWVFHGRAGITACDLGAVWSDLFAPNLKATHPTLAAMPLKGGLDADGRIAIRRGAFSAGGKIILRKVSAKFESLEIEEVSGEIPVLFASPPDAIGAGFYPGSGSAADAGSPAPGAQPAQGVDVGKVFLGEFRYGPISLQDQTFDFVCRLNSISIANDVTLRLPGGDIRLSRLAASDILSPEARFVFSADAAGIDLKELGSRLGTSLPYARVSGRITRGVLAAERGPIGGVALNMEGGFDWEMFGGRFHLYDISLSNLFTSAVTLGMSLDFINVDLEKMTSWPPISDRLGIATGILAGSIRGLEICDREPSRFDLILRAEGRPGKPAVLDVRMASKIIEATGGKAPAFLARLYGDRRLNYERMGVHVILENGKVTFIPLVNTPDHRSYIVKGGRSPALNVGATSNRMPWSWVRDIYLRQIGDAFGAVGASAASVSGAAGAADGAEPKDSDGSE